MTLTAANAAINTWIIANVPDATVSGGPISLDPTINFLAARLDPDLRRRRDLRAMSLLVAERDRGTLAWVASKPVSRGAIWLSKWVRRGHRRLDRRGLIPMAGDRPRRRALRLGRVSARPGAVGVVAAIAFFAAVVLAVSTVISNQAAVAAIGFAVLFLPQILVGLPAGRHLAVPADLDHGLGDRSGRRRDVGFVTPIVWAVSVVALVGFASWRMERMEF